MGYTHCGTTLTKYIEEKGALDEKRCLQFFCQIYEKKKNNEALFKFRKIEVDYLFIDLKIDPKNEEEMKLFLLQDVNIEEWPENVSNLNG